MALWSRIMVDIEVAYGISADIAAQIKDVNQKLKWPCTLLLMADKEVVETIMRLVDSSSVC